MFIQVERGNGASGIYECSRVLIKNHGDTFLMTLERKDEDSITIEVSKKMNGGVYVMSDAGKTVQTLYHRDGHIVSGSIPKKGVVYDPDVTENAA